MPFSSLLYFNSIPFTIIHQLFIVLVGHSSDFMSMTNLATLCWLRKEFVLIFLGLTSISNHLFPF
jgi:hypothetical protein